MKTKHLLAAVLIGSAALLSSCSETPKQEPAAVTDNTPAALKGEHTLQVDTAASKIHWKGNMTGLKSYSHEGDIRISSGNVRIKDGKVVGGNFTIDMNTMKPTDTNYDAERTPDALVGHLGTADFFDVANNPTATFQITGTEGDDLKGTLTLRGKTGDEKVENVTVAAVGDGATFTGKVIFDRQKYGVSYKAANDFLLADNIELDITLVTKK